MRVAIWVLAFGLAGQAWAQSSAPAESGRVLYYRALQEVRAGRFERALEVLDDLLSRLPDDPFADDALLERARLFDEELGQPGRALEAYRGLLARYPSSRLVRRARARIAFLDKHLDQGEKVLAAYQAIVSRSASAPHEKLVREMERLLDDHPDFSLRPDGMIWMAGLLARNRQTDRARRLLQRIVREVPEHRAAGLALIRLAQIEIEAGDLDSAERTYTRLEELPGGEWSRTAREGLRRLAGLRWRQRLLVMGLGLWGVAMLAMWVALVVQLKHGRLTARSLLIPPPEALIYLIVMVVLVVVVWGRARQTTHALIWMAGLVVPLLLANGWLLRSLSLRSRGVAAWCLGLGVACAASIYASIALAGMVDQVLHTLRFGTG